MKEEIYDVIVVGAGVSGLAAANGLQRAGKTVLVIDKARGVGGRTCVKRLGDAVYDHGAQYLEPVTRTDHERISDWENLGLVRKWPTADGGGDRYVGRSGMNGIAKHLAKGLEIYLRIHLDEVMWRNGLWHLSDETSRRLKARSLVLTCPIPQSLVLLEPVRESLTSGVIEELESYYYEPCIALLAACDAGAEVSKDGSLSMDSGPIQWIADNHRKGVSPEPGAITIHAAPAFSQDHYDEADDIIIEKLLGAAADCLSNRPKPVRLHRWRYSRPTRQSEFPCLLTGAPGPLVFAGDAFCRGTVLGAYHSGDSAASQLIAAQAQSLATEEVPF